MSTALGGWPAEPLEAAEHPPRVIGRAEGEGPGPTLICTASLHGNEPAGFHALARVIDTLRERSPRLRGAFVALTGNRAALAAERRFIDQDLNRIWAPRLIVDIRDGKVSTSESTELTELVELLREVDEAITGARGPIHFVDLHTTSGDSPPFATIGDTLHNRAFTLQFGVPIVLGLEEHLDGTFLDYADSLGHITMGFEGGRHTDPAAIDHLAACTWMALAASGVLARPQEVPEVADAQTLLREVCRGVPRVLEVRHRQPVTDRDEFQMDPGFATFDPVLRGQPVARDRAGPIRIPESGRILMPLYQAQGDDGFFVVREFQPFWLAVSSIVRHLRVDRVVHWLPGVRRDPRRPGVLIVNRRTAHWYAIEIFHLLGYRRERLEGDELVVSRRQEPH